VINLSNFAQGDQSKREWSVQVKRLKTGHIAPLEIEAEVEEDLMNSLKIIATLLVCSSVGCAEGGELDEATDQLGTDVAPSYAAANHSEEEESGVTGATLARSGDDFLITWTTAEDVHKVRVYEGTDPGDLDDLVATVTGADSTLVSGLAPGLRHYFHVKGGGSSVVVGERGLPQANALNLRDIGGYTGFDKNKDKPVRWGTFFRSGFIGPGSNQAFLATLGIHTVVDTRNPTEIAAGGEQRVPGATIVHRPVYDQDAVGFDPVTPHLCFPGNQTAACYAAQEAYFGPNGETMRAFKTAGLKAFVTGNGTTGIHFGQTIRDAVHTLLVTLADEDNLPLVWADSGGDARTGWGSAVVELLVGVSEAQVVEDYALSTQFRQAANQAQLNQLVGSGLLKKAVYIEPQLFAYPEYMAGAIAEMHAVYGSIEDYAHQLGITDKQIKQIRKNLLEH
jgi:protein-tyrosine phosphatase